MRINIAWNEDKFTRATSMAVSVSLDSSIDTPSLFAPLCVTPNAEKVQLNGALSTSQWNEVKACCKQGVKKAKGAHPSGT